MEETKGPVMRIIHLVITFLLVSPTYLWTTKLELVIESQRKLFLTTQDVLESLKSASNSGAKGSPPTSINDDSRYITEPHEIAAMFNLHFFSIADAVFAEAGIQHQD